MLKKLDFFNTSPLDAGPYSGQATAHWSRHECDSVHASCYCV